MISGVNANSRQYQTIFSAGTNCQTEETFGSLLDGYVSENTTEIPDDWFAEEETLSVFDIDKAVNSMEKLGVDANREPTHEITDEQREWLKSRHDFNSLSYDDSSPETMNFYADLVYLNVMSADDIKDLYTVSVPSYPVTYRVEESSDVSASDSLLKAVSDIIGRQRDILSYVTDKSNDPLQSGDEDFEFIRKVTSMLENKQECFDVLLGLFQSGSDNSSGELAKPASADNMTDWFAQAVQNREDITTEELQTTYGTRSVITVPLTRQNLAERSSLS